MCPPAIQQFLRISAESGADPTRAEPNGELGLVTARIRNGEITMVSLTRNPEILRAGGIRREGQRMTA
jgi:hypothetical protein